MLKKMICLTFCVMCLLCSVLPAGAAPEISRDYPSGIYTCLVRNGPEDSAAVIGRIENGTALTVLADCDDFYEIDCYDMVGYIAKEQIAQRESSEYYVNCNPDSPETDLARQESVDTVQQLRSDILALAQQQLGTPYVYGGSAPGGFDCSGLIWYVYGQQDYSLQRGASGQMQGGLIVDSQAMEVGDLVFFRETGSPYLASHVGIYAGDGQIIHAGSRGIGYADLDGAWFSDYFLCARRFVSVNALEAAALAELEAAVAAARFPEEQLYFIS